MFRDPAFDAHEQVVFVSDRASGLRAIIAIHSTLLGPAFGGCRMRAYATETEAQTDALRLSRGMTFKAAICGLPYGGGKSVIIGDPIRDKSRELLRALASAIGGLRGRYVVAEDLGTTLADLAVMRELTEHTAAASASAQQPLAVTSFGVLMAMKAAAGRVFGTTDLQGLRVVVQGLGNVGLPLCRYLHEEGAALVVSDVDPARVARAGRLFGARGVAPGAIYGEPADVFAPCALGGVLNDDSIPLLRVRIVCGGANNQLERARHDEALAARGILYVPDYLASAAGVIDFHQERIDDRPRAVLQAVRRIHEIAADVLERAANDGLTPLQVADRMVASRLAAAG